jgi:hypothetical protein
MTPTPVTYFKLALVGLLLVGIFVLAGIGKIDASAALDKATTAIGALVVALGISGAGGAVAAKLGSAAVTNVTAPANDVAAKAAAVKVASSLLLVLVAALLLSGCLSSAPIVPVTPANQAQITACQNTATLHNGVVIGDFVVGGGTTALAATAAIVQDQNAKNDMAIVGAGLGAVTVVGTALAGYSASNFANSQCSQVVGALPSISQPAAGQ